VLANAAHKDDELDDESELGDEAADEYENEANELNELFKFVNEY
jgi:hypothetical protein